MTTLAAASLSAAVLPSSALALTRKHVTAQTLTVYANKGSDQIGVLTTGNTFDVSAVSGAWCSGYAYGHVNAWGWVLCQYLA